MRTRARSRASQSWLRARRWKRVTAAQQVRFGRGSLLDISQKLNIAMACSLPPLVTPASIQAPPLKKRSSAATSTPFEIPPGVLADLHDEPGGYLVVVVLVGGD